MMLEVEKVANVAFWACMSQSDARKIKWVDSNLWIKTCTHWSHMISDFFNFQRWTF